MNLLLIIWYLVSKFSFKSWGLFEKTLKIKNIENNILH